MIDRVSQKLLESRVPEFKDDIGTILSTASYSSKELKLAVKNKVLISEADDGIYALDLKLVNKIHYSKEFREMPDNTRVVKYILHACVQEGEEYVEKDIPVREHANIDLAEALIVDLLIYIEDTCKNIEVDLGGIKSSLY